MRPLKISTPHVGYQRLTAEAEKLMEKDEQQLTPEEDRLLDLLADLLNAYDKEYYPSKQHMTPHKMLHYLMEHGEHKHKDLWPLFGSKSVASDSRGCLWCLFSARGPVFSVWRVSARTARSRD